MTYKELINFAVQNRGQFFWPLFGKMTKQFTYEFLCKCILLVPQTISDPTQKSKYLYGICKKNAMDSDYKIGKRQLKNTIDLTQFQFRKGHK